MAAYNIEQIKDKKKLVKLANYGTAERRNMRPKVLIGAGEEKPFIEGDILDANATQNLIEDTYNKGRIFRSFSKEGKKIDKEIKELLEKTNENYEQLSSAIADNKEDADQKIDQLSSKVDNIESNIPNLRRVVDIQLQSVLDGTKTYLVTKQGDVQEEMQISDGEKGELGEKGDPFTYEDFTPEQIEGLKVKGDRGVSISSLEQTQVAYTSGGVNEFTITLDDGTVSRWYVRNGQKGDATKIWVNANTVHSGYYDSDNHEIKLLNADGGIMSIIDATAFIKDGMISDAYVEDGYIVIVFNTDAGQTPIMIPVTDIFDADDYYTKLDTDARIAEDVLVETQRAEAVEQQLTDNLAQEVSDRLSGDTTLNTKIETETTRATNAEEALSDAIDAEESTRIQEIDDLQDLLDAYIQSNNAAVQAEISRATAAEQTNATAIATESSRATTAEQNLQNDIDAEEQRATAAELDLLDAVDELEQSAGQGITEVQLALSDEITRATGAESQLSSDLSAEITRATNADNANATAISNEVARATLSELQNATDIDAIEALIPSQATSENQLADKAFVNSLIATNTATFVGTFNSITDLYAVTTADVNDYGYVVTTDSVGNTKYNRYKYDGSQWDFEYSLNNSSFTAEEWASIQSGMTQALREKLENLPSSATTSIGISVPTGFTVTGSPIVSSGTIAINFENGYSIPTIASQTNWDTAYGWGNHANAGYVKQVKVGTDAYNPTGGIVSLPAYPTSLPASDVYSWAKASTKPSYTLDEVSDGSTRKLADYLPLSGGTMNGFISWGNWKNTPGGWDIKDNGIGILSSSVSGSGAPYDYSVGLHVGGVYWFLLSFDRGYNRLNYRGGNNDTTYGWYHLIDSNNIGQQSVNYATSAGNADTVDGYHVSSLLAWECMARDLGIDSPFQASVDYFNSLSNLNNGAKLIYNPAGGEYTILFTRRNDATAHGSILKWGYLDNYIRIIRMINGYAQSTDWEKISAGYADSAGSVAWTNVSGRPTNISSFTNDSGYQTTSGEVRSLLTSDVLQNGADCYDENRGLHFYRYNGDDNTLGGGDGWILQWSWNVGSVGGQIYLDDNPSCIAGIRGRNRGSSSFTDWYKFLHTGNWSEAINYTSLGASGWSVATATKLQTSHTIWGQSFDGTGDLGGHLYLNGYLFMLFGGEWLSTIDSDGNGPIFGYLLAVSNKRVYYTGSPVYICGGSYNNYATGITVNSSNNVGIGTTSPSYKVHIVGDAAATNFYTTSDSSKKDNITSLSEHIRKFTLKETGREHYGVIAQEVEEMFREGEEGSYTVNYNSILSYYVGLLENRVAELEDKVKELSHG